MSEPMPVAQTFMMEDFGGRTRLDSIVCVVDAQNFHNKIVQSLQTTCEQIDSAHFMILNKVEGVSPEKKTEIRASIRKLNPHAAIIESDYCEISVDALLDTHIFHDEGDVSQAQAENHHYDYDHHHDHEQSYAGYGHHHDKQQMQKYFFKTQQRCSDLENMKQFLAEISENIFRMKGFLHFQDYPGDRYILQKAGSCFTISKDENWNGEERDSKIVFIGKDIEGEKLQDLLLRDVFV